MVILKRTGVEVDYDPNKITTALKKANTSVSSESERLSDDQISHIVDTITEKIKENINSQRTTLFIVINIILIDKVLLSWIRLVPFSIVTMKKFNKRTLIRTQLSCLLSAIIWLEKFLNGMPKNVYSQKN